MRRDVKEFERRTYDRWASTYDRSCWVPWLNSWVEGFAGEVPEGSSILDVGCGTGNGLLRLAERAPILLAGIDISPGAIAVARKKLSGLPCDLRVADAESGLPWCDEVFDVAVMNATIHHFPDPESVLGHVLRVLKPSGRLIIADPFFFFPFLLVFNLFLKIYPINGDLHFYSQRSLRRMVKNCGLERIAQKPAGFFARYTVAFKPEPEPYSGAT